MKGNLVIVVAVVVVVVDFAVASECFSCRRKKTVDFQIIYHTRVVVE